MREHPIEIGCPKCGAEAGQNCIGKRGNERAAFHRERGSRRNTSPLAAHGMRVDSPLEDAMVSTLREWVSHHEADAEVLTQVPVGPYRVDIAILCPRGPLVVECDGESYHSHRKAIQHDKSRDRYFALQGITVMRFTGSEIRRDPRGCAAQVGMWMVGR